MVPPAFSKDPFPPTTDTARRRSKPLYGGGPVGQDYYLGETWARGNPTAEGTISTSQAYGVYLLSSNHTVWASLDETAGTGKYLDPMGLATAGSTHPQTGYMVAYGDSSGHIYPDVSNQEIWVGGSYEDPCYAEPYIRGITTIVNGLTYGAVGSLNGSGTLDISGSTLEDGGCDPNPSVCVDGNCAGNGGQASAGGLTLSNVTALSDDEITLSYSVDGQASSVGPYNITVMNDVGTSNTYQFVVGDPTPVITRVTPASPPDWQAASSPLTVTVTGTGFGTNPQLSIKGSAVAGVTGVTNQPASGPVTTITATVTLNAAGGNAAITVASRGYGGIGGSGFVPSPPSQPSTSNEVDVTVDAEQAPTVQIMFQGQNVANNGTPTCPGAPACVYVGQQIALTAVVQGLPAGTTIQTQAWSQPGGTVVGGYFASAASGCVIPFPNVDGGCQQPQPCQTLSNSACITFYWVSAGLTGQMTQSVAYSYTLSNGQGNQATAQFSITGPYAPSVAVNIGTVQDEVVSGMLYEALDGVPSPDGGTVGMKALAAPPAQSWPAGSYSWLQLITGYQTQFLGAQLGHQTFSQPALPALDGGYPYPTSLTTKAPGDTAVDSPYIRLDRPGCAEGQKVFSATTYLLWTPAPAPACTGSACTIPVPLGSVAWSLGGDSINTLNSSAPNNINGWILASCAYPTTQAQPQFRPSASYPEWNALGTTAGTCQ